MRAKASARARSQPMAGWLLAVLIIAIMTVGCGVGLDSQPRQAKGGFNTTTTSIRETGRGIGAVLYYVSDGTLVPLVTKLADDDITTLVNAVLSPAPVRMDAKGVITSIPTGTELLSAKTVPPQISDDPGSSGGGSIRSDSPGPTLVLDLSSAFDNVVGASRQQAIAQVVLTVTQRVEYRNVEFRIEGEEIRVSSPLRGDSVSVGACDYKDLLATREKAEDAGLPPATIELSAARRDRLKLIC